MTNVFLDITFCVTIGFFFCCVMSLKERRKMILFSTCWCSIYYGCMDLWIESGSVTMVHVSSVFQVRDGSTSSSPLLGTFCGVEIPPRLQSTQRSLYIHFKTDSSVSNHGFEAAYGSALEGEGSVIIQSLFNHYHCY